MRLDAARQWLDVRSLDAFYMWLIGEENLVSSFIVIDKCKGFRR